jgi:Cu2+-exporting ATPase
LVGDNPHPVAQCLHQALCAAHPLAASAAAAGASPVQETPGHGVALTNRDGAWTLGRPGWRGQANACLISKDVESSADTEFACDGVVLARFRFTDEVRADARAEIAALQRAGRGRLHPQRRPAGESLGHARGRARLCRRPTRSARLTPEEKRDWVLAHDARDTLMLGDGANDSLAFDAAFARGTP